MFERPRRVVLALLLFHVCVSLALSLVARADLAWSPHEPLGLWQFAPDSFSYHREALRLSAHLAAGDVAAWWGGCEWWHVRWIALCYALVTPDPLVFAPVNALTWTVTVLCVHGLARDLFPTRSRLAFVCAAVFGLWPSHLLHSTQLLKDPLFVLGMTMLLWGGVNAALARRPPRALVLIVAGMLLAYWNRPYILEPLVLLGLSAVALGALGALESRGAGAGAGAGADTASSTGRSARRPRWVWTLLGVALTLAVGAYGLVDRTAAEPEESESSLESGVSSVERSVTDPVAKLARLRNKYTRKYPDAGTNVDLDVQFDSLGSVLAYVPRAAVVGFLAPFPSHWFAPSATAGPAARALSGAEMCALYLLLLGFVGFVWRAPVPLRVRVWMLLYAFGLVVLTSLVVTNVGALFRLRCAYLLPVLIGGLEAWSRLGARKQRATERLDTGNQLVDPNGERPWMKWG